MPVRVIICFAPRARVRAQVSSNLHVPRSYVRAFECIFVLLGHFTKPRMPINEVYPSPWAFVSGVNGSAAFPGRGDNWRARPPAASTWGIFLLVGTARVRILCKAHEVVRICGSTCAPLLGSECNRELFAGHGELSASRFRSRARFLAYEIGFRDLVNFFQQLGR